MKSSMHADSKHKATETAGAIRWSIAVAFVLTAVKFTAAILTNSMAIMASALDSLLDMASSSVNLIASAKAAEPPDAEHAYGHEKIESLASFFQSVLIGISGLVLVGESMRRFIAGTYLKDISLGVEVMIFSIVLTSLLTWRLQQSEKKNKSLILATEKLHYAMDLLANVGAVAALFLVLKTGQSLWDLVFSIIIAGYIFKTACGILKHSADELLDRSLPPVSKGDIENIIRSYNPMIVGFHNFRSRRVGNQIFMDFHIEIAREDNFQRAHGITEGLIRKIQESYPGADMTVHYDPEGAE